MPRVGTWNELLYRTWYLTGAVWTAGWLGLGTAFLLGRTRFGYTFALCLVLAGVFTLLTQRRYEYPGVGQRAGALPDRRARPGVAVAVETWFANERWPILAAVAVIGATALSLGIMITTTLPAPGYALDPATGVPTGDLFPGTLRLLTPFMNITGGIALILGAVFSAYVFMPKRRRLEYSLDPNQPGDQFLFNLLISPVAIVVNFIVSIPVAVRAPWRAGSAAACRPRSSSRSAGSLASGGDALNRFGITEYFQVGKFLAVLFLLAGFLVSTEVFREIRVPFTRVRLRAARPESATEAPAD